MSPVKGRYLAATKAVKRGDVILVDEALISGPVPNSTPVCPTCLTRLKPEEAANCPKCTLPLCRNKPDCQKSSKHKPECDIFSGNKVKIKVPKAFSLLGIKLSKWEIIFMFFLPLEMIDLFAITL